MKTNNNEINTKKYLKRKNNEEIIAELQKALKDAFNLNEIV